MSRMSDFPHNYLETIMRLHAARAPELWFAEFISGAVHALQVDAVTLGHLVSRNISMEALAVIGLVTRLEDNSSETQDAYYQGILANPLALLVKRADIADNLNAKHLSLLPQEIQQKARAKYAHALEVLTMAAAQKSWLADRVTATIVRPGA